MKVLLYDTTNAFLTPGGKATHALKLQKSISKFGVDIQFARWWDKTQSDVDLIHFLAPVPSVARLAKERGIRTFLSLIFDFATNLSETEKSKQSLKYKLLTHLPFNLSKRFGYWNAFSYMDCIQFMNENDRRTARRFFPHFIPQEKTVILPHAYDPEDMHISDELSIKEKNYPEKYLVSCANISPRKQTLRLACYAKRAKVPIVFMGGRVPTDPYFKAFQAEVDNRYVFDSGYVSKEWRDCIVGNASGYVLLSTGESGCIAVYEAAAYKLPLLLANRPWAWGYDQPTDISFCDDWNECLAIEQLQKFYEHAGRLDRMPFNALTWDEVAKLYIAEYLRLMSFET